jgi:hypothetical protein
MTPRRLRILAALAITAVLAGGCSMPRLAYQQADWLLLREIDSYLDLQDAQRDRVEGALEASLQRHRTEYLPAFASAFAEAAQRARGGLREADLRWALDQGRRLLTDTVALMLPAISDTLADLTPEQRRHLARRMEERNQEYAQSNDLGAPEFERLRRRARRAVERIEQWTGPLTEEQQTLVRAARMDMPDMSDEWLAYGKDRQAGLMALLERGAPAREVEALLRAWWVDRDGLPPELARKRDTLIEARIRLLARLDATLDSAQRKHLVERLQDLADDATALVREA